MQPQSHEMILVIMVFWLLFIENSVSGIEEISYPVKEGKKSLTERWHSHFRVMITNTKGKSLTVGEGHDLL